MYLTGFCNTKQQRPRNMHVCNRMPRFCQFFKNIEFTCNRLKIKTIFQMGIKKNANFVPSTKPLKKAKNYYTQKLDT